MTEIKEGEVYRWRWADDDRHADCGPYRSYHCKSRIAVVENGCLVDTYWFGGGESSVLDPDKVLLTLVADVTWPTIHDGEQCLYDPKDVVDTRHPNSSRAPIYLRPGATHSAAAILAELDRRQEEFEREIRWATDRLEKVAKDRLLVADGRLEEVY